MIGVVRQTLTVKTSETKKHYLFHKNIYYSITFSMYKILKFIETPKKISEILFEFNNKGTSSEKEKILTYIEDMIRFDVIHHESITSINTDSDTHNFELLEVINNLIKVKFISIRRKFSLILVKDFNDKNFVLKIINKKNQTIKF